LARLWAGFITLLRKRDIAVADHDGPEAIRRRAQQHLPEAAGEIGSFAADYSRMRYGGGNAADARELGALERKLGAIRRAARPPSRAGHRSRA